MLYRRSIASKVLNRVYLFCGVMLCALSFQSIAVSQGGGDISGTGGKHEIQGRIYYPSGRRVDTRLEVKLESSNGNLSVFADANGFFNFKSLAPGNYTILINGGEFYETTQERVFIDTDIQLPVRVATAGRIHTVNINLQPKRDNNTETKTGVIDAVLAKIPKTARELYLSAMDSVRKGENKKAIELLNKAIAAHPEFPLALTELGKTHLKLNQLDEAIKALRSAVKYAPEDFESRLNLGIALHTKNDTVEAEKHLKEAIKRNDASWQAHMYMGLVQIKLHNYDDAEKELLSSLKLGGDNLSLPHYYLGGIYWAKGDFKRAINELEKYVQLAPNAPNAERTRNTIKELHSKTQPTKQ